VDVHGEHLPLLRRAPTALTLLGEEPKNHLSEYLRRVADGERITVTDQGRPVAVMMPPDEPAEYEIIRRMVRDGIASWGGGKPRGAARPARVRGKPVSTTVLEYRR
jgi:prevent-host-death family protein